MYLPRYKEVYVRLRDRAGWNVRYIKVIGYIRLEGIPIFFTIVESVDIYKYNYVVTEKDRKNNITQ